MRITSTCFSRTSTITFLNVIFKRWYFASEELLYFCAAHFSRRIRHRDAALLLFLSLVSCLTNFLRGLSVPGETPLKYHVENNSLSNSHFPLRGWFRRNMHETEASGVKCGKKKSDDAMKNLAIRKIFLFFSLNRRDMLVSIGIASSVKFHYISVLRYIFLFKQLYSYLNTKQITCAKLSIIYYSAFATIW